MKIVILDGYTANPGDLSWEDFKKLGELTVYDRTPINDEAEIIRRIAGADAVITNKVPVSKKAIESSPDLKYIGAFGTGYNVIDCKTAREKGIPVSNIPSYATKAVAQFAISLLLEICGRVGHHDLAVKEGRWETNPDYCFWDYPLIELADKTMGIIGFGRIGQCTGRIAKALGMEVITSSKTPTEEGAKIATYVSREELFARADVISLHCHLFPETRGIINRESIAKMKDGVIIINTARGALIVEQDLADALNSGKVYAVGVDVVSIEPIKGDNPLLKAKNCIITPHNAWVPLESRRRLLEMAVNNIQEFIAGKPMNVVN